MQAYLDTIYESPFGRIVDFKCGNTEAGVSEPEYVDSFSINFTRQGNFGYRIGRKAFDIHSGVVFIEQAGRERVVSHAHRSIRDECTSLELTEQFFEELKEEWQQASRNKRRAVVSRLEASVPVLPVTSRLQYLHASVFNSARDQASSSILRTDVLLVALLQEIGKVFGEGATPLGFDEKLKDRHLDMIDRAKSYIIAHFKRELSLAEIARHAHVSVFHFSRLFKHFTLRSPYQYLIDVRLSHAALLLRHTSRPVTEICYDSGFNSFEHFISSFKQNYSSSPTKFRRQAEHQSHPRKKQDTLSFAPLV